MSMSISDVTDSPRRRDSPGQKNSPRRNSRYHDSSPPGQTTPGQTPPGQTPPGQTTLGQTPPGQTPSTASGEEWSGDAEDGMRGGYRVAKTVTPPNTGTDICVCHACYHMLSHHYHRHRGTPLSSLRSPCSALLTPLSLLCSPHSTLLTPLSSLHSPHSTLLTPLSSLHSPTPLASPTPSSSLPSPLPPPQVPWHDPVGAGSGPSSGRAQSLQGLRGSAHWRGVRTYRCLWRETAHWQGARVQRACGVRVRCAVRLCNLRVGGSGAAEPGPIAAVGPFAAMR
jgi:hypothetical protein